MRPDQEARYARQILLEGVGPAGQERVLEAVAAVDGEGLEHEVARRYAERAGFRRVIAGSVPLDASADLLEGRAPARVLAGSRAALRAFRRAAKEGSDG